MKDHAPDNFLYPSTRYTGSKRRLLTWIWRNVKDLEFESVLDVFGGTASVSLLFKRYGKKVYYNDILRFNQIIATAIIENNNVKVTVKDIKSILDFSGCHYPNFIQTNFENIFFRNSENIWLDEVISNIYRIRNKYKKAILMSSLFQACLAKRPFNLFHRANLKLRTRRVKRSFGNKTTWERPFPELFGRYICEFNKAVFDNNKKNKVIGGYDALYAPNGVDLVYLDPPYFNNNSSKGTNYLAFYHFLEGLSDYKNWKAKIKNSKGKAKVIPESNAIQRFIKRDQFLKAFEKLLQRFQDNIIVLSYQTNGVPSKNEIKSLLVNLDKKVQVFQTPYRYVLSSKPRKQLLFVAK